MNGGFGFGPWQLNPAIPDVAQQFIIASSTINGNGLDDGVVGGVANDGDIDTSNRSWGLYVFNALTVSALRPFTGGALDSGQTFSVDFDTGFFDELGGGYISLLDINNSPVFSVFYINNGNPAYRYTDAAGTFNTTVDYGTEGLTLTVGMTGPTNYTATLTRRDGQSATWTGTMTAPPEAFVAENINAGSNGGGSQYELFINSLSIVPEPATVALALTAISCVLIYNAKRRYPTLRVHQAPPDA